MKPFVINRDTWHYKLNKNFMNAYDHWMSKWEEKHSDFCSYWRATILRMIFATLMSITVLATIFVFGALAYEHPQEFGISVTVIASFFGGFFLLVWYKDKQVKEDKPESLVVQKYRAYKSKVCPKVDFK